jgi:hypothetical protein
VRALGVVLATGVVMSFGVAACASPRIEHGVFHSPKGYQVMLPPGDWKVIGDSRADLELRHGSAPAAMAVNASCDDRRPRGSLGVLARQLLSGLRDRSTLTVEETSVNGAVAEHEIVEGRLGASGDPMRVEVYVMRDARCLYDFVYTAPPEDFARWAWSFRELVETFRTPH